MTLQPQQYAERQDTKDLEFAMLANCVSRVNCVLITLGTLGNLEVAFDILSLTVVPLRGTLPERSKATSSHVQESLP